MLKSSFTILRQRRSQFVSLAPFSSHHSRSFAFSSGDAYSRRRASAVPRSASASSTSSSSFSPLPNPWLKRITIAKPFPLVFGGSLPQLEMEYFEFTTHPDYMPSPGAKDGKNMTSPHQPQDFSTSSLPVLYVMPSMSHSAHIARPQQYRENPHYAPGWWEIVVGSGTRYGIDTSKFRVICASPLGAPYGSSSPLSQDPSTHRPYRSRFPTITPADQALAHAWLLEHLGLISLTPSAAGNANSSSRSNQSHNHHTSNSPSSSSSSSSSAFSSSSPAPPASSSSGGPHSYSMHVQDFPFFTASVTQSHTSSSSPFSPSSSSSSSATATAGRRRRHPQLHGLVGSSMGGMQALSFASLFPGVFSRVAAICCTGRTSPSTVALRSVQRDSVRADPAFNHGDYDPKAGPFDGMAIARKVGTIAYRSREEFDLRFAWEVDEHHVFEVERYLEKQAQSFMTRYDANCYVTLSKCMDLMDLGRGFQSYTEGVTRIGGTPEAPTETMLLPVKQDALIPAREMTEIASVLGRNHKVHAEMISSLFGHDAFLLEASHYNPRLSAFFDPQATSAVEAVREFARSVEH